MLSKLKTDFDGILELVQKCPANLQETALKMILEHWFADNTAAPGKNQGNHAGQHGSPSAPASSPGIPEALKPFMAANSITVEMLAKAFHPPGTGAQLLVSDIAGTGKSQKQANLAILLSVRQALDIGSFTCTLKELREMAVHYNCYDSANFSTNLKAHKNYFKPRAKGADIELSGPGLKKAGELIKGIASA